MWLMLIENMKFEFVMKFRPYTAPDTNSTPWHTSDTTVPQHVFQHVFQNVVLPRTVQYQQVTPNMNLHWYMVALTTKRPTYVLSTVTHQHPSGAYEFILSLGTPSRPSTFSPTSSLSTQMLRHEISPKVGRYASMPLGCVQPGGRIEPRLFKK